MKEMIGGCCVCLDDRGFDENPIVYCDGNGCTVAVHQACYGIITVPTGPWFCRKCESQERAARVRCELCPHKEGALKRTDSGGWCHVVCALYIPEVSFASIVSMEPIIIKKVPPERYNKSCYLCEEQGRASKATHGACMQCNYKSFSCKQHFHVTCAQAMGLLKEESNSKKKVSYCGYCGYHIKKLKREVAQAAVVKDGVVTRRGDKSKGLSDQEGGVFNNNNNNNEVLSLSSSREESTTAPLANNENNNTADKNNNNNNNNNNNDNNMGNSINNTHKQNDDFSDKSDKCKFLSFSQLTTTVDSSTKNNNDNNNGIVSSLGGNQNNNNNNNRGTSGNNSKGIAVVNGDLLDNAKSQYVGVPFNGEDVKFKVNYGKIPSFATATSLVNGAVVAAALSKDVVMGSDSFKSGGGCVKDGGGSSSGGGSGSGDCRKIGLVGSGDEKNAVSVKREVGCDEEEGGDGDRSRDADNDDDGDDDGRGRGGSGEKKTPKKKSKSSTWKNSTESANSTPNDKKARAGHSKCSPEKDALRMEGLHEEGGAVIGGDCRAFPGMVVSDVVDVVTSRTPQKKDKLEKGGRKSGGMVGGRCAGGGFEGKAASYEGGVQPKGMSCGTLEGVVDSDEGLQAAVTNKRKRKSDKKINNRNKINASTTSKNSFINSKNRPAASHDANDDVDSNEVGSRSGPTHDPSRLPLHPTSTPLIPSVPTHFRKPPSYNPALAPSAHDGNKKASSIDEMLEMQWNLGAAFLLQQGSQFEVSSLLSMLTQLQSDNRSLEESIGKLTSQRDHLLLVNNNIANSLGLTASLGPHHHHHPLPPAAPVSNHLHPSDSSQAAPYTTSHQPSTTTNTFPHNTHNSSSNIQASKSHHANAYQSIRENLLSAVAGNAITNVLHQQLLHNQRHASVHHSPVYAPPPTTNVTTTVGPHSLFPAPMDCHLDGMSPKVRQALKVTRRRKGAGEKQTNAMTESHQFKHSSASDIIIKTTSPSSSFSSASSLSSSSLSSLPSGMPHFFLPGEKVSKSLNGLLHNHSSTTTNNNKSSSKNNKNKHNNNNINEELIYKIAMHGTLMKNDAGIMNGGFPAKNSGANTDPFSRTFPQAELLDSGVSLGSLINDNIANALVNKHRDFERSNFGDTATTSSVGAKGSGSSGILPNQPPSHHSSIDTNTQKSKSNTFNSYYNNKLKASTLATTATNSNTTTSNNSNNTLPISNNSTKSCNNTPSPSNSTLTTSTPSPPSFPLFNKQALPFAFNSHLLPEQQMALLQLLRQQQQLAPLHPPLPFLIHPQILPFYLPENASQGKHPNALLPSSSSSSSSFSSPSLSTFSSSSNDKKHTYAKSSTPQL